MHSRTQAKNSTIQPADTGSEDPLWRAPLFIYYFQALSRNGVPRYKLETDRGGAKWFTKVIKVPKITSWKDEIVSFVLMVSKVGDNLYIFTCML
jgi:hypothetical protein